MANQLLFANNARSTLAGNITSVATNATLAPGTGALFPAPGPGQYFILTFKDAATLLISEIVWVTNVTGDIITMQRGKEGTTAKAWVSGDIAAQLITAGTMQAFVQNVQLYPTRIEPNSGVFTITSSDGAVGLKRATSPGVSSSTLPSDAFEGQEFEISDLQGNAADFPITINAPVGMSISNLPAFVLNVNHQTTIFKYFGSNIWGVK